MASLPTESEAAPMAADTVVTVPMRWGKKKFNLTFPTFALNASSLSLHDFKREIERETMVKPKRQKLVGIGAKGVKTNGLSEEEEKTVPLKDLLSGLKPGKSVMMIGSVEAVLESHRKDEEENLRLADKVIDDFDIGDDPEAQLKVHLKQENLEKVRRRVDQAKIKFIEGSAPREGKKLLVLDIDYTLFDHRSTAERPEELRRPFLLEFLSLSYQFYDIVIWSATSMKWIEVKMKELGVMDESREFKILAFVDYTAMISVTTDKYGTIDCKPLGVIWQHPGFKGKYSRENTIMFDDLRRNFLMNPRNGLKIRPFKQAYKNRATDRELVELTNYLRIIRKVKDLSKLDHKRWELLVRKRTQENTGRSNPSHGQSPR